MFEKLNQLAEEAATSVSRRQFLGRLGRGAMLAAAAAAGVLAIGATASAKPPVFICSDFSGICAGQPLNSQCFDRDGGYGKCRKIRGTYDCHCNSGRG